MSAKQRHREPLKNPEKMRRFLDRHFQHIGKTGVHRIQYRKWELQELIDMATESLKQQSSLVQIEPPIQIVGDIHGQINDLLRIIATLKTPPNSRYLFLGDYVDRGRQGLECIVLLLAYKVAYPEHVFLLRGNHECERINEVYGFMDECKRRFTSKRLWRQFQSVFDHLPFTALVGGRILCMHGGLSPVLTSLKQLEGIKRPTVAEDPFHITNDLLWADPEVGISGWQESPRGTSHVFGADVVEQYCVKLGIDLIVRGHQVCKDGYRFFANKKLITLFSAPNYCGDEPNQAAVIDVSSRLHCRFKVFAPVEKVEQKLKSKGKL